MIPAWSPGQYGGDPEIFANDLPPHIRRGYAFFPAFIMTAAGGVYMMIRTIPSQGRHVDPALQPERSSHGSLSGFHFQRLGQRNVFRSPGKNNMVFAWRQQYMLSVCPVYLGLEEEIGIFVCCCYAAGGQGIDARQCF